MYVVCAAQFKLIIICTLACFNPGGGGHSHICPVQVCAAVKTPLFYLTRA